MTFWWRQTPANFRHFRLPCWKRKLTSFLRGFSRTRISPGSRTSTSRTGTNTSSDGDVERCYTPLCWGVLSKLVANWLEVQVELTDHRLLHRGDRGDIGGCRLDTLCGNRIHEALEHESQTTESFRVGGVNWSAQEERVHAVQRVFVGVTVIQGEQVLVVELDVGVDRLGGRSPVDDRDLCSRQLHHSEVLGGSGIGLVVLNGAQVRASRAQRIELFSLGAVGEVRVTLSGHGYYMLICEHGTYGDTAGRTCRKTLFGHVAVHPLVEEFGKAGIDTQAGILRSVRAIALAGR
jgi:hypothetical protein